MLLSICAFGVAGCVFTGLGSQLEPITSLAEIRGTISGPAEVPVVVALFSAGATAPRELNDFVVLPNPGPYSFSAEPGRYTVSAFADPNGNLRFDQGELAGVYNRGKPFDLERTALLDGIDVSLSKGAELDDLAPDQLMQSGSVSLRPNLEAGSVVPLSDPRFDFENGEMGLWDFERFRSAVGGGLFFLEPYDPHKLPILFVHGYTGTPRDMELLISHIDRNRFQPWVLYYPSAPPLAKVADAAADLVIQLRIVRSFRKIGIVGYSLGGLISRALIERLYMRDPALQVSIFVSIATPWNGHELAKMRHAAPVVIPSWDDLAPGSVFLRSLFEKPLPLSCRYHLLFAYEGDRARLRPNNDGFITLESALDPRAQKETAGMRGFDTSHEGILDSPEVARRIEEILQER